MFVNLYRGKEDKVWAGRTIFGSIEEAKAVPCASKEAYIETVKLIYVRETSDTAGSRTLKT
jgi:hypothetical protein